MLIAFEYCVSSLTSHFLPLGSVFKDCCYGSKNTDEEFCLPNPEIEEEPAYISSLDEESHPLNPEIEEEGLAYSSSPDNDRGVLLLPSRSNSETFSSHSVSSRGILPLENKTNEVPIQTSNHQVQKKIEVAKPGVMVRSLFCFSCVRKVLSLY